MQLSSEPRAGDPDQEKDRLVANLRPVEVSAEETVPKRPSTPVTRRVGSTSSGNARARGQVKTRPLRSRKSATVTRQPAGDAARLSVGGLNISLRALVAVIILSVIALVVIPTVLQWADQQRSYRAAVAQTEAAKTQAERLQAELENWDDPEFVAGQARSRLGYVDPGETQYIVTDAEPADPTAVAEELPEGWPPKPWSLALQEEILEIDHPPAVKMAAQVETLSSPPSAPTEETP